MTRTSHACAVLIKNGARNLEEAFRDNPDGPVVMTTTRYATEIQYRVIIGDEDDRSRIIWDRSVTFGATDRTVAGGADFVAAARAQDTVAFAASIALQECPIAEFIKNEVGGPNSRNHVRR